MITLADENGVIDMTPDAISGRTGIPLDIISKGLELLETPDEYSRTPDQEGRRIERLDDHRPWGWSIVNYMKYLKLVSREDKKRADRERLQNKRAAAKSRESKDVAECREVSQGVADVAHIDVDVDVDIDIDIKAIDQKGFENFWELYPKKQGRKQANKAWCKLSPSDQQSITNHLPSRIAQDTQWQNKQFIPNALTFLNNRRWEDEWALKIPTPSHPTKPFAELTL
jgi:hypothetical protein